MLRISTGACPMAEPSIAPRRDMPLGGRNDEKFARYAASGAALSSAGSFLASGIPPRPRLAVFMGYFFQQQPHTGASRLVQPAWPNGVRLTPISGMHGAGSSRAGLGSPGNAAYAASQTAKAGGVVLIPAHKTSPGPEHGPDWPPGALWPLQRCMGHSKVPLWRDLVCSARTMCVGWGVGVASSAQPHQ